MSTRVYNNHTVSATQPPGGKVGDEWYDPVHNYLYKLFSVDGVAPQWVRIPSTNVTGGGDGTSGATAINLATSPTITDNKLSIDLSTYTVFEINLLQNITQITVSNVPAAGIMASFMIIFNGDGTARTVVWPSSFRWPNGLAPSLTSTLNKKDAFVFFSTDGGNNWEAFISGQNL